MRYVQPLFTNFLVLGAGYCLGGVTGLGISCIILALIHIFL
jgi:hypothetical protein